jgi:alkanesulfonate monooxygenase SsuD/methylene tetrahydromethanopterin reductase-like flavin-dependent oxidoreductase (luciferase family)
LFGVYVDNRGTLYVPNYPPSRMLEAGSLAEELGYDSIWVGDSPIAKPRLEPLAVMSALAARTTRVKIGTSIFQPHLRHPVWTALSWAAVDLISNGRTIMGAGIGGGPSSEMKKEAEVFGLKSSERGLAMSECIKAVKALWTRDHVSFDGKYVHLDDVTLDYKPVQKPHPPIWVAGGGWGSMSLRIEPGKNPKVFERVVELGDGWFMATVSPTEYREAWSQVKKIARSKGRDPDSIHRAMVVWTNLGEDADGARQEGHALSDKYHRVAFTEAHIDRCIMGNRREFIDKVEKYMESGVQSFVFVIRALDPIGQVKKIASEILPNFRAGQSR